MDRRTLLGALGAGASAGLAGCLDAFADDPGQGRTPTVTPGGTDRRTVGTVDGETVVAESVAANLAVPWGVAHVDGARYVTERLGRLLRFEGGAASVVRDLRSSTAPDGEGGLLGIAPAPGGDLFAYQTTDAGGEYRNRVLRLGPDGRTRETVLDGVPAARNHDGGRLLVHDGALYATAGDARQREAAQDRDSLAGKVHRLTPAGDPHPDNPFDSTVFSYGHRNPQGLAVDPASGAVFSSEHGPDVDDEVNVLRAGGNYGWPEVTGVAGDDAGGDPGQEYVDPVATWSPTVAPGSAAFYGAGGPLAGWRGDLFVPTLAAGDLRRLRVEDGAVVDRETWLADEYGRLRTAFTGPEGHLYLTTSNRDGRGDPAAADDRVVRLRPA
jgi:glucose/arabinose dehydrogenase